MKSNRFLRTPLAIAVFAATSTLTSNAIADETVTWTGAVNNDWFTSDNWDTSPAADTTQFVINNGDTVEIANASATGPVDVQTLDVGTTGDGSIEINGVDIIGKEINLGTDNDFGGSSNANLSIANSDVTLTGYIDHTTYDASGESNINISVVNDTPRLLDVRAFETESYTEAGETASINVNITLHNVISNTVYGFELGGDARTKNDSIGSTSNTFSNIVITDSVFNVTPNSSGGRSADMEIGSDIKSAWDTVDNTVHSETLFTMERSEINLTYLEFGEYTGSLGDPTVNADVINKITATISDSQIVIDKRLVLGDVGARGDADTRVEGDIQVTFNNTNFEGSDIEITDGRASGGATGIDKAALIINDSDIVVHENINIASDVSLQDASTLIVDGRVALDHSTLSVGGVIEIADLAERVENFLYVDNASSSITGKLTAANSVIDAEQAIVGSGPVDATLRLDQSYLSLTDVLDGTTEDADSLEANEGALMLSSNSLLKIDATGYTRASADNAIDGSSLYGAIDAVQVTLGGTLQINVGDNMDDDATFDIIRAVKDDSLTLGEGAFTGIRGDFDNVIVKNLPRRAEVTTEIVTETIDGVTYEIYRVHAGSMTYFSFALLTLMAGFRRFFK
ncbi:MAG: hypothetical protein COA99_09965 [Moraxellaceae bacterium]|nr:MAG: hypothetical protein COA99_09965 [Moraxellaceae bacterium]